MSLLKHFKRLYFIDYLVAKKATGKIEVFAKKNRLSTNGMLKVLRDIKELGFPIKYDKYRESYIYEKEGRLVKCLFDENTVKISNMKKLKEIEVDNLCFSESIIFEKCC